MGIVDAVKGAVNGNKAYRMHVNANKLANDGKPVEAEEKYREALRLYEDSVRRGTVAQNILQGYAVLLLRMGEFEQAKTLMQKMAQMKTLTDDDRFQLRIQYSIYLWKMGRLDEAIETIGRAAAHKKNGTVYSTLGMYWVDKAKLTGEFEAALACNQEAMDYDDEDAATLDNMGQLYEAMAERESGEKADECMKKAVSFYKRAHKEKPRQITTIYALASIYHERGEDAKARELLSVRDTLYFSAICPVSREMMETLAKAVG